MDRDQLLQYLNKALKPELFSDYAPNGLQVSGAGEIKKIITGVTACEALLDVAISEQADAVLVHHGYFWPGEDPCVVGIKHRRLQKLLLNNINLFAYHLPLDSHAELGNNAQLAKQLNLTVTGELPTGKGPSIAMVGVTDQSGEGLSKAIENALDRSPLYVPGSKSRINKIAWCTGAAQDFIDLAYQEGCDAFLTGEVSERTVHTARELGMHFYAAGHHATERYGIKALGEHLSKEFELECKFVDIDNPV